MKLRKPRFGQIQGESKHGAVARMAELNKGFLSLGILASEVRKAHILRVAKQSCNGEYWCFFVGKFGAKHG